MCRNAKETKSRGAPAKLLPGVKPALIVCGANATELRKHVAASTGAQLRTAN